MDNNTTTTPTSPLDELAAAIPELQGTPPNTQIMMPKAKKFPVMEFFGPTIQGEGSVAGMPTYFLRMGGCDYRCKRCDSMHAVLPNLIKEHATLLTQEEILNMISSIPRLTDAITISGGNPCMWNLEELITSLHARAWNIYVETQGTIWQEWLTVCDVTVSPKGPGMGEKFELDKFTYFIDKCVFYGRLPTLKVVVFDQRDIELMVDILTQFPHLRHKAYFSVGNINPPAPAQRDYEGEMSRLAFIDQVLHSYKSVVEEVLSDPRSILKNVRILPQIHTLLWGNEKGR